MLLGARRSLFGGIDYPARWGVVEHWAGNEASGARLASISSANDMTAVNAPTSAAGLVYPTARQYTAASSQYHSLADNAAVSAGDIDFWLAGWFYFDSIAANRGLIGKWSAATSDEYLLFYDTSTNRFKWFVCPDGIDANAVSLTASTFGALSISTWYFAMAYHDAVSNLIGISINGGAFNTVAHATGVFDGTAAFRVSSYATSPTGFMDGRIGPVTFGKSPPGGIAGLATEIRDRLYNGGAGRAYPWR